MSRNIWTRCAGSSEVRRLSASALRSVESQYRNSTRKLVDSREEQELLEALLETAKPPAPTGAAFAGLHYLLATPFRYPPLKHGSRFGTTLERGIFYGSLSLATCFSEVAYYRFVFLDGTAAALAPITTELTVFRSSVLTSRGVDLTKPPFSAYAKALTSRTSYGATQALGAAMRKAGVEAFLFSSARDIGRGTNIGLFVPAFARNSPSSLSTWHCTTDHDKVEIVEKTLSRSRPRAFTFSRTQFTVRGVLPTPST